MRDRDRDLSLPATLDEAAAAVAEVHGDKAGRMVSRFAARRRLVRLDLARRRQLRQLRVTRKVTTWKIRAPKKPKVARACPAPGKNKGVACP